MASLYFDKQKGVWVVNWKRTDGKNIRDMLGKNHAEDIKRLREAGYRGDLSEAVSLLINLHKNGKLDTGCPTVREYSEIYLDRKKHLRSFRSTKLGVRAFVEMYGDVRLDQVSVQDVIDFKEARGVGLEINSLARELSVLRAMFNHALNSDIYRGINPVSRAGVKVDSEAYSRRVLSPEEEARLLEACNEPLKTIVEVLLYTGMRLSECLGLRWGWIDFDNSVINLPGEITKSKRGRKIALSTRVSALLKRRILQVQDSEFLFPSKSKKGHLLHPKTAWRRALRDAGITNLRLHDLRHTFASRLAKTESIQLVREALGHVDIRTSLRYTHIDDSVLEAVENLSNQEEWEVTLRHPPKNKLN